MRRICGKVKECIHEEKFVKEFNLSGLPSLSEKLEKFLTLLVGFSHHISFFSQYISVPSYKTYSGLINIIFFPIGRDLKMAN